MSDMGLGRRVGAGGGRGFLHWLQPWRWDWRAAVRKDPTRFLDDVFARPSIGPVPAWIITALVVLVAWLTWEYAATAAERAAQPHGADPQGIISPETGRLTILIVTALALIAGWEPVVGRRIGPALQRWINPVLTARALWIRIPRLVLGVPLGLLWRTPSIALSILDWLLARPVALLAGVRIVDWVGPRWSGLMRYLILLFWLGGAIALALNLDAPWGLVPLGAGFLVVFGVVRRWQWIEADREAFLIERGGPAFKRVGFQEDLRDEALTAVVFLFVLIPLSLQQVDLAWDAFDLFAPDGSPIDRAPTAWDWFGFFGAELSKSAPFVDWSEVFHVANGSPIRPHGPAGEESGLGAALVFLLRATLDLFLVAAVLQAVQIAARVSDQNQAFRAGRLPILDPFAEYDRFKPLAGRWEEETILARASDVVADFPPYESKRLAEIAVSADAALAAEVLSVDGEPRAKAFSPVEQDTDCSEAALMLLAHQNPDDPRTTRVLAARAKSASDLASPEGRALQILVETNANAAVDALSRLAFDQGETETRLWALRAIGRFKLQSVAAKLNQLARSTDTEAAVRAHALLAAVKIGATDLTSQSVEEWNPVLGPRATWQVHMPFAYAQGLRMRMSQSPLKSAEMTLTERAVLCGRGELDRTAPIPAGTFWMGAADGEEGASPDEYPRHEVRVRAFAMGVYAVTFEEFDAFCEATGRKTPGDQGWGRGQRPVINVSWNDAQAYCAWLNEWTGERFRLPSEAEWEYACRAGTTTRYSFGDEITKEQAQFSEGSFGSAGQTVPVDQFQANDFGLYQMHGNVWEWCADRWHESYAGAPQTSAAWLDGASPYRVLRGGSWYEDPEFPRSAYRSNFLPEYPLNYTGFRLARTLVTP